MEASRLWAIVLLGGLMAVTVALADSRTRVGWLDLGGFCNRHRHVVGCDIFEAVPYGLLPSAKNHLYTTDNTGGRGWAIVGNVCVPECVRACTGRLVGTRHGHAMHE